MYSYRAVDSTGVTIDFLLSAKRDAIAAERFLAKALGGENHPGPRVINTDEHAGYPPAIVPPLSLECEISLDTVILDEKRGVRFCRRRFLNASGIARQGKG